jgi:lipopolysaccharide export system protein LptC
MALVSAWLLNRLDPSVFGTKEVSAHTPDYYVEGFTTTTMDDSGLPRRRLRAEYMAHFPDTDTHEFSKPYLVIYRERGEPWHVTSERGWLSAKGDVMLLLGKVHIWRNTPDGRRRMDIQTEDLRVLPDSDYGETDTAVVITTPHSQARGVGMRAFMETSRLELLSQVQTVYERHAFLQ